MAWVGKITSLDFNKTNNTWVVGIDYYDDVSPDNIFPRILVLPARISTQDAVAAVQNMGEDIKAMFHFNAADVVGTIIQIP